MAGEGGAVDGSVQLVPAPRAHQAFRADIAKLLVHSRARRRGLGAALMQAAEAEARRMGRTLLTLDTETGSGAERLYLRLGWTLFGQVPGYALRADGSSAGTVSFFTRRSDGRLPGPETNWAARGRPA